MQVSMEDKKERDLKQGFFVTTVFRKISYSKTTEIELSWSNLNFFSEDRKN